MENRHLISIKEICLHYNLEDSFISSLHAHGLLEMETGEEDAFLSLEQLKRLEQLIVFHKELEINLEGIEVVSHLLAKIIDLQKEVMELRNKVKRLDSI